MKRVMDAKNFAHLSSLLFKSFGFSLSGQYHIDHFLRLHKNIFKVKSPAIPTICFIRQLYDPKTYYKRNTTRQGGWS